jgi:hypothetical protein
LLLELVALLVQLLVLVLVLVLVHVVLVRILPLLRFLEAFAFTRAHSAAVRLPLPASAGQVQGVVYPFAVLCMHLDYVCRRVKDLTSCVTVQHHISCVEAAPILALQVE